MNIFIVTVNYNSAENVIKLLDCLKSQTDTDFTVVVVDNHSSNVENIKSRANNTNTILLENSDNFGFAGGSNRGIQYSFQRGADWVLLLNPDTWIKLDFMETLKQQIIGRSGLCGLPIHEGEATAYGGRIRWLTPPSRFHHIYKPISGFTKSRYIIGAALLISKDAFSRLGQLDEEYFLYFEDADYSAQARRKRIPVSYLLKPIVYHAVSVTTCKLGTPLLLHYQYRNVLYFNRKNGPWLMRLLMKPWVWYIQLKQLVKIVLGRDLIISRAILTAVHDFNQGQMGKIS